MKIHLDRLGDRPLDWREELTISAAELQQPELAGLSEIDVQGQVSAVSPGFLLRATLSYEQKLRCTRCLRETREAASTELQLLLVVDASTPAAQPEEQQVDAEDLGMLRLPEPELETGPMLVEQVLLNVPMKPLCSSDCAGLCSSCGADLNSGACECAGDTDPRWAALAALREPKSS